MNLCGKRPYQVDPYLWSSNTPSCILESGHEREGCVMALPEDMDRWTSPGDTVTFKVWSA